MLKYPADEICDHIDFLFKNLQLSRSVLPYITDSMVGKREIPTPGYYRDAGYSAKIILDEPLTIERIRKINVASDSVNQGFIVRLQAYLNSCGVYDSIKKNIEGNEEIDILRRLRHLFAHESGERDQEENEHNILYERIIKTFKLKKEEYPLKEEQFPIPIDAVIEPLIEKCKKYIIELDKVV